jgi:hypothetical protein
MMIFIWDSDRLDAQFPTEKVNRAVVHFGQESNIRSGSAQACQMRHVVFEHRDVHVTIADVAIS